MSTTLIGTDLKKTGKLTKYKMLTKKKKQKSQNLIMMKNIKHIFPP